MSDIVDQFMSLTLADYRAVVEERDEARETLSTIDRWEKAVGYERCMDCDHGVECSRVNGCKTLEPRGSAIQALIRKLTGYPWPEGE